MGKKKSPLNNEIAKIDLEISRAQLKVSNLQRARLQLLRIELSIQGLSGKTLEELRAADGGSFTQEESDHHTNPSIFAKSTNAEVAYYCPFCGWIKGSPEPNDTSLKIKSTCAYCNTPVAYHYKDLV